MKKANGLRNEGISLRVIHVAMVACALVVCLLLVFSTYQSSSVFSTLSNATANYINRQKAAHDLMEASDYLTENVQRFTLEGDTKYLDNYFEEAFVNRRRESSITSMSENEAEQSLVAQVQAAMDESMSLMYREYYAMKLVLEAKEIRYDQEKLRGIELKETDAMLTADEKMELAQSMVMGSEYYSHKEVIRTKLKTALELLDKQMMSARQESANNMNRELTIVRAAIIALTVVILGLIALTAWLGTIPLIKAEEKIRNNELIKVRGAREFRSLAKGYNRMYRKLYDSEEEDA